MISTSDSSVVSLPFLIACGMPVRAAIVLNVDGCSLLFLNILPVVYAYADQKCFQICAAHERSKS